MKLAGGSKGQDKCELRGAPGAPQLDLSKVSPADLLR
jgi:hypothetical protein